MGTIKLNWKSTCKINLFICCLMLFAATGCNKDDGPEPQIEPKSSEKQITSFVFLITNNAISTNIVATIDEENKTITATMPPNTNITGLLPEVKISALASISHDTAQNFTDPIDYTVTAEDGSTTVYTVTITMRSTQRQILQAILDANPENTLPWDLNATANLDDLFGVTLNTEDEIIELSMTGRTISALPKKIGELVALERLDLGINQINSLPPEIGQLKSLTNLNLSTNNFTSLPPGIGQLVNLKSLGLNRNQLSNLPSEIFLLTKLESLYIGYNQITQIPTGISQLSSLKSLNINSNELTSIPSEIGQLSKLEFTNLRSNKLTSIPSEIGQLFNLVTISLQNNKLTSLPPEIGQLGYLTELLLNENQLTTLPEEIGQLTSLKYLGIRDNQITILPPEIGFLNNLLSVQMKGNNLMSIPRSICFLVDFNGLSLVKDDGISCSTSSLKDALIQIYSANPGNTLGWGVDNYPGVKFNDISNPTEMTMNNKNLTRIPEDINVFGDLEVLNINSNDISSFPEVSTNLRKLTTITAASNNLTTVPDSFQLLTNLTLLSITNNPISSIPAEVCELQISNGGILTILADAGEGCN